MAVELVWESAGPVFLITGVTNFTELRAAEDEFYRDPRSDRAKQKIVDLRDLDEMDISHEELAVLGAFHVGQSRSTPGIRQAIVSPEGCFEEEIAAFTDVMTKGYWETERFFTMEEARAWAGERRRVSAV